MLSLFKESVLVRMSESTPAGPFDRAREAMAASGDVVAADRLSPSALKLYEAQFFGFTPQTCMLRIYSAFQECLCGILVVVEKVCVRKLVRKQGDATRDEELLRAKARECSHKLQGFLEQRFRSLSKRMDALLVDNCFSIPPNVILPGDTPHQKHPQSSQVGLHTCFTRREVQQSVTRNGHYG